ncbi:MAG: TRAP transporter small permease [Pseudomonadota bacterium]
MATGQPIPPLLHRLDQAERIVTAVAFGVMVLAIFADVLAREFTGVGLHWARQAGVYANVIVVMLGLGLASSSGSHLRPRFADSWLPASWEPALVRIAESLTALFFLAFAAFGFRITASAFVLEERSVLIGVLVWPIMAAIPLAFAIAALRHAAFAFNPTWRPPEVSAIAGNEASNEGSKTE